MVRAGVVAQAAWTMSSTANGRAAPGVLEAKMSARMKMLKASTTLCAVAMFGGSMLAACAGPRTPPSVGDGAAASSRLDAAAARSSGAAPDGGVGGAGAIDGGGAPALDGPAIAWSGGVPADGGDFVVVGFPAVSPDGARVLVAQIGEDGGRGAPNLVLEVRGRDDRTVARRVVLDADDVFGPPPAAAPDVAAANAWIATQGQGAAWRSLAAVEAEAASLDAGPWRFRQGDAELSVDGAARVRVRVGQRAVVSAVRRGWLKPSPDCVRPLKADRGFVDAGLRIAVVDVWYLTSDLCDVDGEAHVVAW